MILNLSSMLHSRSECNTKGAKCLQIPISFFSHLYPVWHIFKQPHQAAFHEAACANSQYGNSEGNANGASCLAIRTVVAH